MFSTSSVCAPISVEQSHTLHSGTSPDTGSMGALYDLLVQAGLDDPVDGNQGGSYLTMKSNQGMVFGAATILSGFAGVFCDQGTSVSVLHSIGYHLNAHLGYWQRVSHMSSGPQSAYTVQGHRQCTGVNDQSICELSRKGAVDTISQHPYRCSAVYRGSRYLGHLRHASVWPPAHYRTTCVHVHVP